MPISDYVIDYQQPFRVADRNTPAGEAWKWAGRELSPVTYVLIKQPEGGYAGARAGQLGDPALRRQAPGELEGTLGEMSLLRPMPAVDKAGTRTRDALAKFDEDPDRPVIVTDGDQIIGLITRHRDSFGSETGDRLKSPGSGWFLLMEPDTRVNDAIASAEAERIHPGRPIIFCRPDGSYGHVFPAHLAGKWAELINNVSDIPVGKIPVGNSFVVDRYSDGRAAVAKAEERDSRGIVIVLDEGEVAGVVVDPSIVRGIGDDFYAASALTELYGMPVTEAADPRADIQAGRKLPCPHCGERAQLAYDIASDTFTCAECQQVLG